MKKIFYSLFLLVAVFLVSSCGQDNIVDTKKENVDNKTVNNVAVSMDLSAVVTHPKSRALDFSTDANGFPTPDNLKVGSKVPVLCIFRSSDPDQPITKVMLNWDVEEDGIIRLKPTTSFNMAEGTDLTKEWYVMGVIGGTPYNGTSQVTESGYGSTQVTRLAVNGFMGHVSPSEKISADVPFIFGWRKLNSHPTSNFLSSQHAVQFQPMGTFVRVQVSNKINFNIKYNGFRLISSSPVKGDFALDDASIKANSATLADTQDGLEANNALYSSLLTFTGTSNNGQQIGNRGGFTTRNYQTALYYNDFTFSDGDVTLNNNGTDTKYLTVWMMPQAQNQSFYSGDLKEPKEFNERNSNSGELVKTFKTQFLLHSIPENSDNPSINMLPVLGTTDEFTSGQADAKIYKGNAYFRYTPLHYLAKTDNMNPSESVDKASYTASKWYSLAEVKNKRTDDGSETMPSNYVLPNRNYWQALIGYWGFANDNNHKSYYGTLAPTNFGGTKKTFLVATSGSEFVNANPSYAISLGKMPSTLKEPKAGQMLYGAHVYSGTYRRIGGSTNPQSNDKKFPVDDYKPDYTGDYQFAMRTQNGTNELEIEARYLGPNFVLDIADISDPIFWQTVRDGAPKDFTRYLAMAGLRTYKGTFAKNWIGDAVGYWINEIENNNTTVFTTAHASGNGTVTEQGNETYFSYSFNCISNGDFRTNGYYYPAWRAKNTGNTSDPTYTLPIRLIRKTKPFKK